MIRLLNRLFIVWFLMGAVSTFAAPLEQQRKQIEWKAPQTSKPYSSSRILHTASSSKTATTAIRNKNDTAKPPTVNKQGILDYLPITIIVAVLLFIAREIFDLVKKLRQERNKKQAIAYLISAELKLNYWSQVSLFRAYKELADLFEKYPEAIYRTRTTRFGKDIFECKEKPDRIWSGHPIPKFISDKYNSLLPSLAELDIKLANTLESTYAEIAELEHFRQTLVLFLANEDEEDEVFHEMTKDFIKDFTEEEKDFFQALNKGYVALVGKDLTEWRLR